MAMDKAKLQALMRDKKQALKKKDKTIKAGPGANRFVLLPGWRVGDEQVWWHDFGMHYIKDESDQIKAVYPCAKSTYGKECPICDGLHKAMRSTTDDDTLKVLKEAASGKSYLVNVLALDSDSPNVPQILELRPSAYAQIVDLMEEWADTIFDGDEAQIMVINRDGKGLNTKYTVQMSPKKYSLSRFDPKQLHDLDDYVKQESEEQMRLTLSAINSVAGFLPAPSAADKPRGTPADWADSSATHNAAEDGRVSDIALGDELDHLLDELPA